MTRGELAGAQEILHGIRQVEEPQCIGNVRAALADQAGEVFLRVAELLHEPAVVLGFLQRIQVLTLYVLNQRQLKRLPIVQLTYDDRDLVKLRPLGSAPASFAGNDLVFPWLFRMRTYEDWL